MSGRSWQRSLVLAVLVAMGACGGGGDGPSATRTTVAFTAPARLGVEDVREGGNPRLAVTGAGPWLLVWGTPEGVTGAHSTDVGATWSARFVVAPVPGAFGSDVACDPDGSTCIVVWKAVNVDDGENDVFAARSLDAGLTWAAPVRLSRAGTMESFNTRPSIATDGAGTWIVVWDALDPRSDGGGFEGTSRIEAVRSRNDGASWLAPVTLSPADREAFLPRIAADAHGRWVVVWSAFDEDAGYVRLAAARSSDGRHWSAPVAVVTDDSRRLQEMGPDLATDGAGTWHLVWTVQRPDEAAGGTFHEIATARSTDGGATWSDPRQLDVEGASTVDILPRLAADSEGHVVVVWLTSIEANRMRLLTVQSADRGRRWSAPADVPGGAANPQVDGLPEVDLATDGHGAWAATWVLATPDAPSITELHDAVVATGTTVPVTN